MCKALSNFFTKPRIYAFFAAAAITAAFVLTLMDAFVFEKVIAAVEEDPSALTTDPEADGVVITDRSYKDKNISIEVITYHENGVIYHVAEIKLASIEYLKSAFAKDKVGKNIVETASSMAERRGAIFAVNGDYYGFRYQGLVIRNGSLYLSTKRPPEWNEVLAINRNGDMFIIREGEKTGKQYIEDGIIHTMSFGPALVLDGKALKSAELTRRITVRGEQSVSPVKNPRTAVGQVGPLHYLFVVIDGRTDQSSGMTLNETAKLMERLGCTIAYNSDGGSSSTMYLNGKVINTPVAGDPPVAGKEREISDIFYIS